MMRVTPTVDDLLPADHPPKTMNIRTTIGLLAVVLVVGAVATTAAYAADQDRSRLSAQDGTCEGDQTQQRMRDRLHDCNLNCTSDGTGMQYGFTNGFMNGGQAGFQRSYSNQAQLDGAGIQYRAGFRHGLP